jgi:predicted DNA-binding protein
MKKDSQFTFRIPLDLKDRLEEIAASEGRSMAQICVAFLQEGIEMYAKKGSSGLQRLLSQSKRHSR